MQRKQKVFGLAVLVGAIACLFIAILDRSCAVVSSTPELYQACLETHRGFPYGHIFIASQLGIFILAWRYAEPIILSVVVALAKGARNVDS